MLPSAFIVMYSSDWADAKLVWGKVTAENMSTKPIIAKAVFCNLLSIVIFLIRLKVFLSRFLD